MAASTSCLDPWAWGQILLGTQDLEDNPTPSLTSRKVPCSTQESRHCPHITRGETEARRRAVMLARHSPHPRTRNPHPCPQFLSRMEHAHPPGHSGWSLGQQLDGALGEAQSPTLQQGVLGREQQMLGTGASLASHGDFMTSPLCPASCEDALCIPHYLLIPGSSLSLPHSMESGSEPSSPGPWPSEKPRDLQGAQGFGGGEPGPTWRASAVEMVSEQEGDMTGV